MVAIVFRLIKVSFSGLLIITALAMANDPPEDDRCELVAPAEPWVVQRHEALRDGAIPPPSPFENPVCNEDGWAVAWPGREHHLYALNQTRLSLGLIKSGSKDPNRYR